MVVSQKRGGFQLFNLGQPTKCKRSYMENPGLLYIMCMSCMAAGRLINVEGNF